MIALPPPEFGASFYLLTLDKSPKELSDVVGGWTDAGFVVRVVRGRRMQTWGELIDEFAAAFQFPLHFGRNPDALHDTITDLDWLPTSVGYITVVTEPDKVLSEDEPTALADFLDILALSAKEWGEPVALGEWWDRPALPFYVILQAASTGATVARWRDTNIRIVPLDS